MQTIPAASNSAEIQSGLQSSSTSLANRAIAVVGASALVALCAHIALPLYFTPIPLTLQTFAVLLVGFALGPQAAFAALALYLAEGAAGLPVFNPHGPGGLAQLLGPTGGFLLSYPFAAAAAGAVYRRTRTRISPFLAACVAGVPASIVIFAVGAVWLGFLTHANAPALWTAAVAPFLPGEVLKVAAAAGCVGAWQRWKKY